MALVIAFHPTYDSARGRNVGEFLNHFIIYRTMQYRRTVQPGGTFFFTLVTYNRGNVFANEHTVELLREAVRVVMISRPFEINASVILPDHLHMIWTLPEDDGDYPTRWRLIKSNFSHRFDQKPVISSRSRVSKGEQSVWQRRYWEHLIRDVKDLQRHIEYIHNNPVKHGYVHAAIDWPYSSLPMYVKKGIYPSDWASDASNEVLQVGE